MMDVFLGKNGLKETWQGEFPEEVECISCKASARIGFVVKEEGEGSKENEKPKHICNLHKNEGREGKLWLHDNVAVAVYFCTKCLEPTARYNQA